MADKSIKHRSLKLLFVPVRIVHRILKALLYVIVVICRLPADFLLLSFHYIKGISWLAIRTAKKTVGIKTKTSPYKCLTSTTIRGAHACRPGKKYQSLFIFKTFCPDAHWESVGSRDACCLATIIKKHHYWRPPTYRLVGVGIFLLMSWSMILFAVFHFARTSGVRHERVVAGYLAHAQNLFENEEYLKAIVAYRKAAEHTPGDAQVHLEMARCLVALKDYRTALSKFEDVIRMKPDYWEARLEFAHAALELDQANIAFEQANAVLNAIPDHSEANLIIVHCLIREPRTDEALTLLKTTVAMLPNDNPEQLELAARAFHLLREFELATINYAKAVDINPNYIDAHLGLAYIAITNSNWEEASEHIKLALRQDPMNLRALVCRADMLLRQGEFDAAESAFEEIIRTFPNEKRIKYQIARHLINRDLAEKAIELLTRQVNETPDDARSYSLLAYIYLKRQSYRMAVIHCKKVLSMPNVDHDRARRFLISGYIGLEKYNLALDSIGIVLAKNPGDFSMTLLKAEVFFKLKDYETAISVYEEAAEIEPNSWLADVYLGTTFSAVGDYDSAIASYRRALVKIPNEPHFRNNLAMALIASKRPGNAGEGYQIAENLYKESSGHYNIADTLALALYSRGEYGRALQILEKAILTTPGIPALYYRLGEVQLSLDDHENAKRSFTIADSLLEGVDLKTPGVEELRYKVKSRLK